MVHISESSNRTDNLRLNVKNISGKIGDYSVFFSAYVIFIKGFHMEKQIKIGGKEYLMKASALIPRQYRFKFGRDLIVDMQGLQKAAKDKKLGAKELTVFENVAWLMLKAAGSDVGKSPEEWLDSIDGVFDVYEALPQMLELWGLNLETTAKPVKK